MNEQDPMKVTLRGGPGVHNMALHLDGEPVYALSVAIEANADTGIPKVTITPDIVILEVEIDSPKVVIPEETALLLKQLGWTPPSAD